MAKMYRYFIFLTLPESAVHGEDCECIFMSLDHLINEEDIISLNKTLKRKDERGFTYSTSQLLKVTGDFHYHVIFENHFGGTKHHSSCLCKLDHKVTVKTYKKDMVSFISQFSNDSSICEEDEIDDENDIDGTSVLSYVEVPEE